MLYVIVWIQWSITHFSMLGPFDEHDMFIAIHSIPERIMAQRDMFTAMSTD
jgi:hypothetical protein